MGPERQNLRVVARRLEFPISATPSQNDSRAYLFLVGGDLAAVDAQSEAFNGTLIWSFVLLGLGAVVAAVFLQVRIGLLPLKNFSNRWRAYRDGSAQTLEGRFPAEIAPRSPPNSIPHRPQRRSGGPRPHPCFQSGALSEDAAQRARQRSGSIAGTLGRSGAGQVGIMRRQVDHYLAPRRAAGSVNVLGNRTEVCPVIADLARVLTRIHAGRAIAIESDCPASVYFRGERQDLEERWPAI